MPPSSYLLGVSGYWHVGLAPATLARGVSNAVQVPPPRHRVHFAIRTERHDTRKTRTLIHARTAA